MKPAQAYLYLTKPGIVFGNAITAAAGFLLASAGNPDLGLGLSSVLGLSLVISSACVANNVIDRRIDTLMARTKKRGTALKLVPPSRALVFAGLLGAAGFGLLIARTNLLTTLIALAGFVIYVAAYGFAKRRSPFGTVIGSFAGAVPPVVGYTAVTGRLDSAALLLFGILVLWQMPHFYAIALYRLDDYKSARLPVLPAKRGVRITKIYILTYVLAFALVAPLLTPLGYTGPLYLGTAALLGLAWLWLAASGFRAPDDRHWARRMFAFSLVVICILSVMISLGHA